MALFVIGDPHLSLSCEKPMDIFGSRWTGYVEKFTLGRKKHVSPGDTVVLAGDISWAMTTDEAKADFDFIESLPGEKYILKGNHDYWWQTMAKLDRFVSESGYRTIRFLHNNAYEAEDFILCGARGWYTAHPLPARREAMLFWSYTRKIRRSGMRALLGYRIFSHFCRLLEF